MRDLTKMTLAMSLLCAALAAPAAGGEEAKDRRDELSDAIDLPHIALKMRFPAHMKPGVLIGDACPVYRVAAPDGKTPTERMWLYVIPGDQDVMARESGQTPKLPERTTGLLSRVSRLSGGAELKTNKPEEVKVAGGKGRRILAEDTWKGQKRGYGLVWWEQLIDDGRPHLWYLLVYQVRQKGVGPDGVAKTLQRVTDSVEFRPLKTPEEMDVVPSGLAVPIEGFGKLALPQGWWVLKAVRGRNRGSFMLNAGVMNYVKLQVVPNVNITASPVPRAVVDGFGTPEALDGLRQAAAASPGKVVSADYAKTSIGKTFEVVLRRELQGHELVHVQHAFIVGDSLAWLTITCSGTKAEPAKELGDWFLKHSKFGGDDKKTETAGEESDEREKRSQ